VVLRGNACSLSKNTLGKEVPCNLFNQLVLLLTYGCKVAVALDSQCQVLIAAGLVTDDLSELEDKVLENPDVSGRVSLSVLHHVLRHLSCQRHRQDKNKSISQLEKRCAVSAQ